MAYITARELRAVVPDQYRDAALADQGGEQPDPGLLAAVIETACQEVDALIEGRVRLPLSTPYPQKIRTAAVYFALEILFTRRGVEMPEATARKIAGIRSDLGKVGAGDLRLEAPVEQTAASRQTSGSIVVRPSITGAGGMIGAIMLLLFGLARPAHAIDARTFSFVAQTNPLFESPDYMEWSQAESVGLRYAVPSADSRDARWEISDATNLWLNLAPTKSGANWSWNPSPTQTCLAAGRYQGRVALYDRAGSNLVFHRVLALQDIRVHPARDPAALIMASPLSSITSVVTIVESDPIALAAAANVQSNLMAHAGDTHNPHGVTAAQIGAATGTPLYVETDVAGLSASATVQSNLTAHATDTNNPHAVTAAQIGALTAEEDPDFTAWAQTANVAVACSGGWLFPDYFTATSTPYSGVGTSYGPTSQYNSVFFSWQTVTPQKGYVLEAKIDHQSDWSSDVTFANPEVLEIREDDGHVYADWPGGTTSGTVGRVTATLGDYSRTLEFTYSGAEAAKSNAWWVGDVPGSFRHSVNVLVSNLAWASGKTSYVFWPWPYSTTNFVRNTNCWTYSLDLTCASPWNSVGKNFYAGTAITPQHFIYAAHFVAPTGTTFRWIDSTNGIWNRTLVAQRLIGSDIAIGLLDSALPSNISPAKALSPESVGVMRGMFNLKNSPGFRVIALDQAERPWMLQTPIMAAAERDFPNAFFCSGSTNWPFSRLKAEGGDSGNPIFLVDGTNVMLLSTFASSSSGAFLSSYLTQINAALVAMGGSAFTSWTAADLSAWTNYDAVADITDL